MDSVTVIFSFSVSHLRSYLGFFAADKIALLSCDVNCMSTGCTSLEDTFEFVDSSVMFFPLSLFFFHTLLRFHFFFSRCLLTVCRSLCALCAFELNLFQLVEATVELRAIR